MIGDDVVNYLNNRGIGTKGTDLFLNFQPNSPDTCITIYDETAPTLPESSCLTVDNLGIQVLVRNEDDVLCKNKSKEIHKILAGFGGESLVNGGDIVSYVTVNTSPASIGIDKVNRHEWSSHYIFRVESLEGDENRL